MKRISKIEEINTEFEKYEWNYTDSYSYGKEALEKYKDKVISFRITDKYCFILLKGKQTYFGYKFYTEENKIKRIFKMNIFTKHQGAIVNKKEFKIFKKHLVFINLK